MSTIFEEKTKMEKILLMLLCLVNNGVSDGRLVWSFIIFGAWMFGKKKIGFGARTRHFYYEIAPPEIYCSKNDSLFFNG